MKIPLLTGAYEAKSIIADAQRCVNLYPEGNPKDSPFPTTHYLTPGLTLLSVAPENGYRGAFTASNGTLYVCIGQSIYRVTPDWAFIKIGTLDSLNSPVSMVDNTESLLIVDGTPNGYTVTLGDDTSFSKITQAAFYGSESVWFADGFFILGRPSSNQFYISGAFTTAFDPLDFAAKSGYSDRLVCVGVTKRYIFLFGEVTTEVWVNSGAATFPYQRIPGPFIQHGCAAPASVVQMDGSLYFLSQSPQGEAIVMRTENYDGVRISTHALENEIQSYQTISDAMGYCYQQEGHFFYVLQFPSANKTWVFDAASSQWHERAWVDANGNLNRHRGAVFSFFNNTWVVGDWENGNLYSLDVNAYTDNGNPIPRIRSFPHFVEDGNRVMYREFIADMEVGNGGPDGLDIFLRWSDTRGKSWGNAIRGHLGPEGDYIRSLQFQRLGMARDRVFELSWSGDVKTALNGAYLQYKGANQ